MMSVATGMWLASPSALGGAGGNIPCRILWGCEGEDERTPRPTSPFPCTYPRALLSQLSPHPRGTICTLQEESWSHRLS